MPWWWPFGSGGGDTSDLGVYVGELATEAAARPSVPLGATAAVETAAGLLARALARARVTGTSPARAGCVSPAWLVRVGFDLVRGGEHLAVIDVAGGVVRLSPAARWEMLDARGDGEPWWVRAWLPQPVSGEKAVVRPASGVVSLLWAPDPARPWRGVGPLQGAALTARLSAASDRSLGLEAGGQVGHLVTAPRRRREGSETYSGQADTLDRLDGRSHYVGTAAAADPAAQSSSAAQKPESVRIGADPPEAAVTLQKNAYEQVLAACGVPLALALAQASGQERESYRRFVSTTVEPVAEVIAAELAAKLDAEQLRLDLGALAAADMAGRARAVGSLVKAGYDVATAAAVVGIDPPADPQPADDPPAPLADAGAGT